MVVLRFLSGLILVLLLGTGITVNAQIFITNSGDVEFVSTAPLLTFKGTSQKLNGYVDLSTGKVDFYVDLNTLDTGNRRRDRDMRQVYLETEKYPFAEFSGSIEQQIDPDFTDEVPVSVNGTFKIHGVERPMTVEGTMRKTNSGIHIIASWVILLEDYNIERPRVVFYELSDTQTINIDVNLSPEE